MNIVFLTNFSDACFRATPAVAQMVDDFDARLTIVHFHKPSRTSRPVAERTLSSFFPEADRFGVCRRFLGEGDPIVALKELDAEEPIDLIVAPSADPLALPRFHRSLRARLLTDLSALVWTINHPATSALIRKPPRKIACWVDFEHADASPLKLALDYVEALGGTLQLLHVLPTVHEGTFPPQGPLQSSEVLDAVGATLDPRALTPEVHISTVGGDNGIPALLRRCEADLLIVGQHRALVRGWLGKKLNPVLGRAPCPVVCVGQRAPKLQKKRAPSAISAATRPYDTGLLGRSRREAG